MEKAMGICLSEQRVKKSSTNRVEWYLFPGISVQWQAYLECESQNVTAIVSLKFLPREFSGISGPVVPNP